MRGPYVIYVGVVIGDAEHRAHAARDTLHESSDSLDHGASGLTGTRDGRFFSNISKIRRYSSAHDEGLTNA